MEPTLAKSTGKHYIDFLYIVLRMKIETRALITIGIFLLLPILTLVCAAAARVENIWFYLVMISWFGLGLIIYTSVEDV